MDPEEGASLFVGEKFAFGAVLFGAVWSGSVDEVGERGALHVGSTGSATEGDVDGE